MSEQKNKKEKSVENVKVDLEMTGIRVEIEPGEEVEPGAEEEVLRNQGGEEVSGSEEVPGPSRTVESSRPEVELEVLRIPPNPRCVICRYRLLADEIRINLWVKSNKNFKRGMKLVMHEQAGEEWKYEGVLPRHAGRW